MCMTDRLIPLGDWNLLFTVLRSNLKAIVGESIRLGLMISYFFSHTERPIPSGELRRVSIM